MSLKDIQEAITVCRVEQDFLKDFIYPAQGRDDFPIFKVLLTNMCQNKCKYCVNNLTSSCKRFVFKPEKLASHFMSMYRKKVVKGIFISSAIYKNADFSQEKILETIIILRKKFNFTGYIHAKVLPTASLSLIKKLFDYADRVSINLEYPTQKHLSLVSSKVLLEDLMLRLKYLSKINKEKKLASGITTQFIVGGQPVTDREYLNLSFYLYRKLKLKRIYYSGFVPFKGTPLENVEEESILRVRRLYEADFLLRDYGILPSQLHYDVRGNLFLDKDVKEAFATKNFYLFPVNINKADLELLIKVPGIGKKTARRIIRLRNEAKITSLDKLKKIGVSSKAYKWLCI